MVQGNQVVSLVEYAGTSKVRVRPVFYLVALLIHASLPLHRVQLHSLGECAALRPRLVPADGFRRVEVYRGL